MLRVLCFGGRDYRDAAAVDATLSQLAATTGPFLIINGGARGADAICKHWGLTKGWPVITMDAAWQALGKPAGSTRNGWMLEFCQPQYAVEFPGGSGTADMRRKIEAAGVTLWRPFAN